MQLLHTLLQIQVKKYPNSKKPKPTPTTIVKMIRIMTIRALGAVRHTTSKILSVSAAERIDIATAAYSILF